MGKKKYPFNERFFEKIETEKQAYWLGFLSADAGISGGSVQVNLKSADRSHLALFLKTIERGSPIRDVQVNGHGVSRICVSSQDMINDLLKLGVTPRKSLTLEPWVGSSNLMPHYWRGVFDGDGSISRVTVRKKDKRPYPAWKIALNGSYAITSAFRQFVLDKGGSPGYFEPHGNVFKVAWGGSKLPALICRCLYLDATVFLERKQSIAMGAIEYVRSRTIIEQNRLQGVCI